MNSGKSKGHILDGLSLYFFPGLHIFPDASILVVDAVVLETGCAWEGHHRGDGATASYLTPRWNLTFYAELVKVPDVGCAYLSAALKNVVVSNFHRSLN